MGEVDGLEGTRQALLAKTRDQAGLMAVLQSHLQKEVLDFLEQDAREQETAEQGDAASIGEIGSAWRAALDETRNILGSTLFDDAIEVARAELHRWLDRAPQLVGRVVAAAVAREASGVAARAVAVRAAAERLARGSTEDEAEAAAVALCTTERVAGLKPRGLFYVHVPALRRLL